MASQYIEIPSTASRLSVDVRRLVDGARSLQELSIKAKDVMDQVAADSDWASLATKLGTDEAAAEATYNLITPFAAGLNTTDYNALIDRLG